MGIVLHGGPHRLIRRTGLANDTCLWGPRPLLLVGKQAAGTRVASSPDSDLEAFSHNPAHGSFAPLAFQPSAMTNCANQRKSRHRRIKSNVAMNAWLPQASYPCGNFSDTSSFKFRRSKGSLGPRFHDVPPQPNSPPDNVFRPDRPAEAGLGSKKRGIAPLPIHGIRSSFPADSAKPVPWLWFRWIVDRDSGNLVNPFMRSDSPCSVPVLSWLFDARGRPPKEPFPVRPPAGTRRPALAAEAARAVRRQPTGSGLGPPCPALRANPFPRLRIHFADFPCLHCSIDQSCSPWRPDAVMSTTGRGRHSVLRIFKGRRGRTGHRATCGALPAAGPYLRLSHPHRRPLRPGSRPRFCSDRRALLLIGAWHLPRRPGVGRALKRHPFSGLVDSAVWHRNPASGSSRIASSAYQKWPLGALDSVARLNEAAAPSYLFKNSHPGSSYPEGNFGGNQLLDGSISLSPLYPSQTNDLHVSIAAGLHQSFLWLRPAQA
ncbi:hypothetical protein L1887_56389 [Cichorium endivia]|nr:hypothetical protein L1887_56389 [Cichorium endivia]